MLNPNFNRNQFIDDVLLNTSAAQVSGNLSALGGTLFSPGLFHPEAVSWTLNGLIANVTAPLPFQVMFGTGVLASAHGMVSGQDTQKYAVNFTGLVPASGSITAYLVCQYSGIQQFPVQVTGPPVGHPDFNAAFQPYTGYSANVDSLNFVATATPPDNSATFEVFRCTLAAGATGLATAGVSTIYQNRAAPFAAKAMAQVSGNVTVQPQNAGTTYVFNASGTLTLPPAAASNGLPVTVVSATQAVITIQAQGNDLILGTAIAPGVGQASTTVVQGGSVTLQAQFGNWQITSGTAAALGSGPAVPVGSIFFYPGTDLPAGTIYANGQLYSKTTYPALFAKYGYAYGGSGDMFGVPDARNITFVGIDNMGGAGIRGLLSDFGNKATTVGALIGAQNVALSPANLPAHTHNFSGVTNTENQAHNHTVSLVTSDVSVLHSHNFSGVTNTENQTHDHGELSGQGSGGNIPAWNISNTGNALDVIGTTGNEQQSHTHNFSGTTTTENTGHTHNVNGVTSTDNQAHSHNFSGTTDGGNNLSGTAVSIVQPSGVFYVLIKAA